LYLGIEFDVFELTEERKVSFGVLLNRQPGIRFHDLNGICRLEMMLGDMLSPRGAIGLDVLKKVVRESCRLGMHLLVKVKGDKVDVHADRIAFKVLGVK
jgi:hypothetical protein